MLTTIFRCLTDLEQAQKCCSPSFSLTQVHPWVRNKYGKDEVLMFAKLTLWWPISWGSEVKKKMCFVPKTLINLLLLNSNNLTHWSRARPICFLWGSVSFPAVADSVIRDDGREAGGARTFNVIRSSHWEDTHEGTQDLPKEALLQITADSQSCGDTGSGSLGCDWIQQTFIECLQVEPTLIRCLLAWPLIA